MALIAPAHRFFRDLTPELSTSHNAASAKINEKENIVIREQITSCTEFISRVHFVWVFIS